MIQRLPGRATTVIVECKQCRADFLKDSRRLDALLAEREQLDQRRRHLEERLIKAAEPHLLFSGTMLFPEMEAWDFAASRSPAYRAVLRDLRRIDRQIHGDTKFWTIARYALADHLLIAAPAGLLRQRELPPGWGLLEFPAGWLSERRRLPDPDDPSAACRLRMPLAGTPVSKDVHRARLLRNIAVAATCRVERLAPLATPNPPEKNAGRLNEPARRHGQSLFSAAPIPSGPSAAVQAVSPTA